MSHEMMSQNAREADASVIEAGYDWLVKNSTVMLGLSTIRGLYLHMNSLARPPIGQQAEPFVLQVAVDAFRQCQAQGDSIETSLIRAFKSGQEAL